MLCLMFAKVYVLHFFKIYLYFTIKYYGQAKYPAGNPVFGLTGYPASYLAFGLTGYPAFRIYSKNRIQCIPNLDLVSLSNILDSDVTY
jgi:hypothetical protein